MKYKFAKDAGQELIQRFVEGLSGTVLPKKAVLVPVPMHKEREKWRGFNHALELGKLLCQQTGWEIKGDVLFKQRKTTPQTELRGTERKKNLRGVFDVGNKAKEEFLGKTVVIFDDVWTTGSTLKECTKVLKRNGAGIVWGLTLARTR